MTDQVKSLWDRIWEWLHIELFQIGSQPIQPVQLILLLLTVLVTLVVAGLTRRLLERRLLRSVSPGPRYTIARLGQYLTWVLGALLGLELINVDVTALAVVAGALGVGIGFGLQNVTSNFVAGLLLLFERPIKVNDRVTVGDIEGDVVEISFRATRIRTNDNISVIVPNSNFVDNTVINWSHGDPLVRIRVSVGVAYGSDVELVTRTLMAVAADTEEVLEQPPCQVHFMEFGDSSLNFDLLVWIDQPARHPRIRSKINYKIDAAFRRHGIQIPFPQRDLHLRSAEAPLRLAGGREAPSPEPRPEPEPVAEA